jgi:hypothetical protein
MKEGSPGSSFRLDFRDTPSPAIRDQIERGDVWGKSAVKLRVRSVVIDHVSNLDAERLEVFVLEIVARAVTRNVYATADSACDSH